MSAGAVIELVVWIVLYILALVVSGLKGKE